MKTLLTSIIFIAALLYAAETKIALKPFSIKFATPEIALGLAFIVLGISCYYYGGYRAGKKKGIDMTIEYFEKQKTK